MECVKKRGRKPKIINEDVEEPKKRGRKPKSKTYDCIQSFDVKIEEDENIILHIPLTKQEIDEEQNKFGMNPILFSTDMDDYACFSDSLNIPKKNEKKENDFSSLIVPPQEVYQRAEPIKKFDKKYTVKEIKILECLFDFNNEKTNQKWPKHTTSACFWCAHKFDTMPVGIPHKYYKGNFYLSGCFCSYNCAATYLFFEKSYDCFEKYSLLNFMYSTLNNCDSVKIKLAPPREILKLFGGTSTIEEFRNNCLANDKIFNLVNLPIISMIPQLEEVHREEVNKNTALHGMTNHIKETKYVIQGNSQNLEDFMSLKIK